MLTRRASMTLLSTYMRQAQTHTKNQRTLPVVAGGAAQVASLFVALQPVLMLGSDPVSSVIL